jgi:carbon monoxide dehydrogenase subunit G
MKITEIIRVTQSPKRVWELFQDVPSLSRCLPGAELTADLGDGEYEGVVSVKMGPMTATFEGKAMVTSDEDSRTGTINGKGNDKRGGSMGRVKIDYSVEVSDDGGTRVTVEGDVQLSGAAAQFGRTGLIKDMSKRLITEFVGCVEEKLAADTVEEAAEVEADDVRGISLFFASLGSTISRLFGKLFGRGE